MTSIDAAKTVLQAFLFAPTQPKYIREVEQNCQLSYERVHHYLNELEKIKALRAKTRGKIKEYWLNTQSEFVIKVLSLIENDRTWKFYHKHPELYGVLGRLTSKILAIDYPNQLFDKTTADVKFIVLFGSTAREESALESDIDLLIAVKNRDKEFDRILSSFRGEFQTLTGKKLSLHVVEMDEFRKKWKTEPFYASLWLDRIVLYGEETFWREVLRLGEPI